MIPLFTYHITAKQTIYKRPYVLTSSQWFQCDSVSLLTSGTEWTCAVFLAFSHLFPLPNSSLISLWGTILAPPCAVWGRWGAIDHGFCLLLSKTQTCNSSLANWFSSPGSPDKAKTALTGSHSGGSTRLSRARDPGGSNPFRELPHQQMMCVCEVVKVLRLIFKTL